MEMIKVTERLKRQYEQTFPAETVEQAVDRLLRAELEAANAKLKQARAKEIIEKIKHIRDGTPSTTNDEIWALRKAGRP
jgi:hypothetical protein